MALTEQKSFCRICNSHCGMIVTTDAADQIVAIRPDKEDPMTRGFACFKGLQAVEQHDPANRIATPLKRQADGSFVPIGIEQALDEIAEKIAAVIARDGPEAVGGYRGTGSGFNAIGCFVLDSLFAAIGTHKVFSATTIDQSAKSVARDRIGTWGAGMHPIEGSDVLMILGMNPLLSYTPGFAAINPLKQMKDMRARGMKLLVVDPRETETARFADIHLRPAPGEDATLVAGMIREVLHQGWEDQDFVARYVEGLEALRAAVAPFTPDYVARRAEVDAALYQEMIRVFATTKRGRAITGTGANMGPHSNLVEHLVTCLNLICGRVVREGELIPNPGALVPRYPRLCQVMPAKRSFDKSHKSRLGDYGMIALSVPEMPTGIMADEILQPGPGQIRAFFVHGGNPAVIVPDQRKMVRALKSLELLVVLDPFMTPTAKLADYVLPTMLQYERADLPCWQAESSTYWRPFARYTPAVSKPAEGMEIVTDEHIFGGLIKRLGGSMTFMGAEIDMAQAPTSDDLLRVIANRAGRNLDAIKPHPLGLTFDDAPVYAEAGSGEDRFTLVPPEIITELGEVARESFGQAVALPKGRIATHRLTVRRQRHMFNSINRSLPATHRRIPFNSAMLHPSDMQEIGVRDGDRVTITSRSGSIKALAEADPTLRPGMVSMTHGYGDLPDVDDYQRSGVAVNALLTTDADLQTINAMPWMTAVPVAVERADETVSTT